MRRGCPVSFFSWYFIRPFCPLFKRLFRFIFGVKVSGAENIPAEGPFIIASNHRSYIDPPVIASVFPEPVFFVAKEELFRNPFIGFILKHLAAIPVKRGGMDKRALKSSLTVLKGGCYLCIFPEGTRAGKGTFLKPKPGVGMLVLKSGVKVIPVYLGGTDDVMPRGTLFPKLFGRIKVVIGKPVEYKKDNIPEEDPYQYVAEDIMRNIRELANSV